MRRLTALLAAAALSLTAGVALADDVMLVVDSSASMGGKLGTDRKIDLVSDSIEAAVADFPTEARIGLIAFGSTDKKSCTDAQLLVKPQRGGNDLVAAAASSLQPRGRAPLAVAVERAATALDYKQSRATLVVFVDRVEACDADPCLLAEALKAKAKDLTIEVIGLGLADDEISGVACLADKTGGHFINAEDETDVAGGLAAALAGAKAPPANLPTAGIDAPDKVVQSTPFDVGYDGPKADGDRVQIAWPGLPPGSEIRSALVGKDGKSRRLLAPAEAGTYELRYYHAALNAVLATKPLEVDITPVTIAVPQRVAAGAPFVVNWTGPAAPFDEIRIAPVGGGPDLKIIAVKVSKDRHAVTIEAPIQAGSYEARYYSAPDSTIGARAGFTVDPPIASVSAPASAAKGSRITVAWKGPAARYDDVVIAKLDMAPADHLTMARIRPDRPTVSIMTPAEPGTYELRYVAGDGRIVFARAALKVE